MAGIDIEFEGLKEVGDALIRMQLTHPDMRKDVNKIIAYVLREARNEISKEAKTELPNDPRDAYKAVRHSVYKRIFGGQVNILARRKNNGKMYIGHPPRKLRPGQRGGNRMKRSARTEQVDSYYGNDRGFILRFLNAGTYKGDRMAGSRDHNMRLANRKQIAPRNWFGPASQPAMDKAALKMEDLITRAIQEVWGENTI